LSFEKGAASEREPAVLASARDHGKDAVGNHDERRVGEKCVNPAWRGEVGYEEQHDCRREKNESEIEKGRHKSPDATGSRDGDEVRCLANGTGLVSAVPTHDLHLALLVQEQRFADAGTLSLGGLETDEANVSVRGVGRDLFARHVSSCV
jgi:hypothetical protein